MTQFGSDHLKLTDFLDLPTLQEIQDSFAAVANVKVTIADAEGHTVTQAAPTPEFVKRQAPSLMPPPRTTPAKAPRNPAPSTSPPSWSPTSGSARSACPPPAPPCRLTRRSSLSWPKNWGLT